MAGLERALPASYYLDEEAFRRERERVLYREWFCAGRADQLPRPGSLQVVDVAGESVLLVRTRVGELAAQTPDRDLVLGPLPGHDRVLVALGAAHGFKFAPCWAGSWPTWPARRHRGRHLPVRPRPPGPHRCRTGGQVPGLSRRPAAVSAGRTRCPQGPA